MRMMFATLPALGLLAACGGGAGPQTVSVATAVVPTAPVGGGQSSNSAAMPELLKNSETTAYRTLGGTQLLREVYTPAAGAETGVLQRSEFYSAAQAPLSTLAGAQVEVTYDPRAAIFSVSMAQPDIKVQTRYQDPAHRTDFGGAAEPQINVPSLPNYRYVENSTADEKTKEVNTFFYQLPGTGTRYVTLGGFIRNAQAIDTGRPAVTIERVRGVEVFGNQTPAAEVPKTGTATYSGNVLASMVSNVELDINSSLRSRFEWIAGTGTVNVDFGAGRVNTSFNGTVVPGPSGGELGEAFTTTPNADWRTSLPSPFLNQPWGNINSANTGKSFTASGTATFDRSGTAFSGAIANSTLGGQTVNIAGSAVDGTFFGPGATEAGVAFRVVGATPDQRVDITGGFTGVRSGN